MMKAALTRPFWLCAALLLAVPVIAQQTAPATGGRGPIAELKVAIAQAQQNRDAQPSVAYRTNYPFACLQLRKAEMTEALRWRSYGQSAEDYAKLGLEAIKRIGAGTPYYAEKGKLSELAYIADNDGSAQPYYLHLPTDYDPAKPWPLIVFMHGYVPTISVLDPWVLGENICQIAEDNGAVLLIPYARRNTDFQGVGEVDVLASTEEVKALYNIDPLRVYMSGVSMGGMGAWNMTLRHPGMYAASTPISGHTDMHVWWPRVRPDWPVSRDDIPPFRRFLVEWDNPVDLVQNAANQQIFVQHGEKDTLIPVEQSRTIVQEARKLGISIKLHEFKGEGHYIYWDEPCFRNAWSWQKQFKLDPSPRQIIHKAYSLEYGTSYWLQITDFVQWGKPATVNCTVTGNGSGLRITSQNVRQLRVNVQQSPLKKINEFDLLVNGKRAAGRDQADGDLYVQCDDTAVPERQWPPRKRKGLCGPVEEVFDTAFLVVIGSGGDEEVARKTLADALTWAEQWDSFADGVPRVMADTQVTDADIAQYNLVLFGTPGTNSVLARMADKLPITIGDHEYEVRGKTHAGPDLGLVMCYPNPLAPDRCVAIYAGELYGAKCGINHKHDLIPDFIVFEGKQYNYDDTNRHLVAGYFDMNWDLSPDLTWVRE